MYQPCLTSSGVSSQRRKSRKAHFSAPSNLRRRIMSCHLSKDLKTKYEVRAIPVRKGDVVKIMRGSFKTREGKVQTVYRKKWCIHIEKITKEKKTHSVLPKILTMTRAKPKQPKAKSVTKPVARKTSTGIDLNQTSILDR